MSAIGWAVAAILAGVAGVAARIGTREMRRIKGSRFAGRQAMDGVQFFEVFYKGSGLDPKQVVAVRDAVGRALEVPADLLRPDDRFEAELAPTEGWEGWWDENLAVMREMGLVVAGARRKLDWKRIMTLDDVIRQLALPS